MKIPKIPIFHRLSMPVLIPVVALLVILMLFLTGALADGWQGLAMSSAESHLLWINEEYGPGAVRTFCKWAEENTWTIYGCDVTCTVTIHYTEGKTFRSYAGVMAKRDNFAQIARVNLVSADLRSRDDLVGFGVILP